MKEVKLFIKILLRTAAIWLFTYFTIIMFGEITNNIKLLAFGKFTQGYITKYYCWKEKGENKDLCCSISYSFITESGEEISAEETLTDGYFEKIPIELLRGITDSFPVKICYLNDSPKVCKLYDYSLNMGIFEWSIFIFLFGVYLLGFYIIVVVQIKIIKRDLRDLFT